MGTTKRPRSAPRGGPPPLEMYSIPPDTYWGRGSGGGVGPDRVSGRGGRSGCRATFLCARWRSMFSTSMAEWIKWDARGTFPTLRALEHGRKGCGGRRKPSSDPLGRPARDATQSSGVTSRGECVRDRVPVLAAAGIVAQLCACVELRAGEDENFAHRRCKGTALCGDVIGRAHTTNHSPNINAQGCKGLLAA